MRQKNLEIIIFYVLIAVSVFVRYYSPLAIGNFYFIGLLVFFFASKSDYFWLAFFFFLLQPPGYLFYHLGDYHLPVISLTSTVNLTYGHLIVIVAFLKTIALKGNIANLFYRNGLLWLLGYLVFLVFYTIIHDYNLFRFFGMLLFLLPLLLIYCIPRLINTEEGYYRLFRLLFSLVIVTVIIQFIDNTIGEPVSSFLGESYFGYFERSIIEHSGYYRMDIYGTTFMLISFIAALYYLTLNKGGNMFFKRYYLYTIIALIFISLLATGTRGWIISLTTMLLVFSFVNYKKLYFFKILLAILIIFLVITFISDDFEAYIYSGLDRIETLELLIEGDQTAGGTLGRIDSRAVRVYEKFKEEPIFGFGFTNEYRTYRDSHVGHHNMLLNAGVVGYILFSIFFIYYNYKIYGIYRFASVQNKHRKSILVFIIGFIGIFIIHSTSVQMFGYDISIELGLMFGIYLSFSNNNYQAILQNEESDTEEVKYGEIS